MHLTVGTYVTYQIWCNQSHKINYKKEKHYMIEWKTQEKLFKGKTIMGQTFPKR